MGKNQVTENWNPRNIVTKTTDYTITTSDDLINFTGTATATLPTIASLQTGFTKSQAFKIVNATSTGTVVTVTPGGSDTINGASTYSIKGSGTDYIIIHADITASNWVLDFPDPLVNSSQNIGDGIIRGQDMIAGKLYSAVSVATSGTTAQNVFSASGAPCALTITQVISSALDGTAANIITKNGTTTVSTIAKGTAAGGLVGETNVANATVAAGATVTVESSATNGNSMVTITYTVV